MSSVVITGDTSGSVTLSAPAVAGTTTLTLPTANGTIITTGSTGQSIPKAALPTGSVLQVVQTVKSDTFTTTSSSYVDITGLSVNITPTSVSSKILVIVTVSYGGGQNSYGFGRILRNGTAIAQGDSDGASRTECTFSMNIENTVSGVAKTQSAGMTFLDSPATTSSITYKIQGISGYSGSVLSINRSGDNNNDTYSGLGISSITVMEIAA